MSRYKTSRFIFAGCYAGLRLKKLNKADYEALADFRYGLRKFLHFSEAAAQNAGLASQQHQALLAIKGFPGRDHITIGELAERLQIKHHSAVGLADRLVTERYIQRLPGKQDRRQVYLTLTRRGQSVLEKLSATHQDQLQRIGSELEQLLNRVRAITLKAS